MKCDIRVRAEVLSLSSRTGQNQYNGKVLIYLALRALAAIRKLTKRKSKA